MIKLTTGVLLVAALLMACPAQGQLVQQSVAQTRPTSMSKASFEMAPEARLDRPREIAVEEPMQRGFSAAGVASALIEVLASQNAVTLEEMSSSPMDAYLRPPQEESDDSGLFRQAKSFYNNATTIRSDRAELRLDPLSMRCALRIKLNLLGSN